MSSPTPPYAYSHLQCTLGGTMHLLDIDDASETVSQQPEGTRNIHIEATSSQAGSRIQVAIHMTRNDHKPSAMGDYTISFPGSNDPDLIGKISAQFQEATNEWKLTPDEFQHSWRLLNQKVQE